MKKVFLTIILAAAATSCVGLKEYQRPQNLFDNNSYVENQSEKYEITQAIPWQQIFTDPQLQKHISLALAQNYDLKTAYQNILQAEAYLQQSRAAVLPGISAGPEYSLSTPSQNSGTNSLLNGTRRYIHNFGVSADLQWEIDIWGRLSSLAKARLADVQRAVWAQNAIKSDLVAAVAGTYYQLQALDSQKKIFQEAIRLRQRNLEVSRALKIAGILTEVAVQQSEALLRNAEAQLVSNEAQIKIQENALNILMGQVGNPVGREDLNGDSNQQQMITSVPTAILENRPDVRQAEAQLISIFHLTNAARAAFYPTLSLTGSTGIQASAIDNLFSGKSLFANVVSGLTAPIFNRRQIRTAYEVSQASQQIAYLNFRKTLLSAGQEVSNALANYDAQEKIINLKTREIENNRKSVDYSQQLVNYGMANYLEVLNASVNLTNAQLQLINAQYAKLRAKTDLYQALGGGWQ